MAIPLCAFFSGWILGTGFLYVLLEKRREKGQIIMGVAWSVLWGCICLRLFN